MKQKIKNLVKEYLGLKVIIAAIVGALFSWGISYATAISLEKAEFMICFEP